MTKAALVSLTKTLAVELGPARICVCRWTDLRAGRRGRGDL